MNEDIVQLGGVVELSGFGQLDKINNVVINKIVGSYARKFGDTHQNFEKLHLNLKPIHNTEKKNKVEVHAKSVVNGKVYSSQIVDYNLYFALDSVLKKLKAEMEH